MTYYTAINDNYGLGPFKRKSSSGWKYYCLYKIEDDVLYVKHLHPEEGDETYMDWKYSCAQQRIVKGQATLEEVITKSLKPMSEEELFLTVMELQQANEI